MVYIIACTLPNILSNRILGDITTTESCNNEYSNFNYPYLSFIFKRKRSRFGINHSLKINKILNKADLLNSTLTTFRKDFDLNQLILKIFQKR